MSIPALDAHANLLHASGSDGNFHITEVHGGCIHTDSDVNMFQAGAQLQQVEPTSGEGLEPVRVRSVGAHLDVSQLRLGCEGYGLPTGSAGIRRDAPGIRVDSAGSEVPDQRAALELQALQHWVCRMLHLWHLLISRNSI